MSNNTIKKALNIRCEKIEQARGYLISTKELFDKFGSEELKETVARFNELNNSLNSSEVKLVVLGEFSRGKSSLVNALLNINLLPTNLSPTTAINTFIRALPDGQTNRIIRIHYIDPNKQPEDIPWNDDSDLEKWGTELDKSNAEKRKDIDKIEAFTDNELLKKGLILVDTPGLGSINTHHDMITRKAIAEAHIAIFVQSTDQLGGTEKEWKFVKEVVSANFDKFITVVNRWDAVLDPADSRDKKKTEEERVKEKLNYVKDNFKRCLGDNAQVLKLTDDKHLIPVSALWAKDSDIQKQKRSGMDKLENRITELFSKEEAVEQIYTKPLKQLKQIQSKLKKRVQEELELLNNDKSEAEQQREIDLLEQQIQNLELETKTLIQESREEHKRNADYFAKNIENELLTPLIDLKNDIENRIDESYVRNLIVSHNSNVSLPPDLDQQFKELSLKIGQTLQHKQDDLKQSLEGLRNLYANKMAKFAGEIQNGVSNLNLEIPDLDVNLDIDFSAIESYHTQQMQLKQEMEDQQNKLDDLEVEVAQNQFDPTQLKMAQMDLQRVENQISQLGGQPSPYHYTTTEHRLVEKNTYSADKYADVQVSHTDDSNVRAWREEKDKLEQRMADKEAAVREYMAEQQRMHNIQISKQAAMKQVERELKKRERELNDLLQKQSQSIDTLVRETTQKLRSNTAGQLDKKIKYISSNVLDSVRMIYSNQMDYLEQCVKEQYLEPLNDKRQQREEVLEKIKQGKEQIAMRKAELSEGQEKISNLLDLTEKALSSVNL